MFALFSRRECTTAVLPANPIEWGVPQVYEWLHSLNRRRSTDRAKVLEKIKLLEEAILAECRAPFSTVQEVLRAELRTLPVQLRLYRELHETMRGWLM